MPDLSKFKQIIYWSVIESTRIYAVLKMIYFFSGLN